MSGSDTKKEPTLFLNARHPSAIMIYIDGFEDCIPVQIAMVLNGNGELDADTVAKFTALFVAAPETKRQRDDLWRALKAVEQAYDCRDGWTEAMALTMGDVRRTIRECKSDDASTGPMIDPDVRQMIKAHGYPEATDDAEATS